MNSNIVARKFKIPTLLDQSAPVIRICNTNLISKVIAKCYRKCVHDSFRFLLIELHSPLLLLFKFHQPFAALFGE